MNPSKVSKVKSTSAKSFIVEPVLQGSSAIVQLAGPIGLLTPGIFTRDPKTEKEPLIELIGQKRRDFLVFFFHETKPHADDSLVPPRTVLF